MPHPLDGAFAKIERAEHHLRCLDKEIDGWTEVRRASITVEKEPRDRPTTFRHFSQFEPVPDIQRWALLIGDAVHNLRSALDHAVYACSGPKPPVGIEFPVILDPSYMVLPKSDRRSYRYKIRGIRNDVVRTVIYRAQPWRRKHATYLHTLWILHQLDIQDKHRLLTPVAGVPERGAFTVRIAFFEVGDHFGRAHGPEWVPFDKKAEFLTVDTDISPRNVEMEFNFHFVISLRVAGATVPLLATLDKVRQYARALIEEVRDALIEGEASPPAYG